VYRKVERFELTCKNIKIVWKFDDVMKDCREKFWFRAVSKDDAMGISCSGPSECCLPFLDSVFARHVLRFFLLHPRPICVSRGLLVPLLVGGMWEVVIRHQEIAFILCQFDTQYRAGE
jgi:hypothetical protein